MRFKNYLLFFCACIAFTTPMIAQRPQRTSLPKPAGMSDRDYGIVNAKFQRYEGLVGRSAGVASKTTAGRQRLIAQANYSRNNPSKTLLLNDSAAMVYSGSRGSRFDEYSLAYDWDNVNDYPNELFFQNSYINYDTLRQYDFTGSVLTHRSRDYDAAGRLILAHSTSWDYKVLSYLPSGRLSHVLSLIDLSGVAHPLSRSFYVYSSNGSVVKDSMESYDGRTKTWSHIADLVVTTNTKGQISIIDMIPDVAGSSVVSRSSYTYDSNGMLTQMERTQVDSSGNLLERSTRNDFVYTSGVLTYSTFHAYNYIGGAYYLKSTEARHLNAAGRPDTVHYTDPNNPGIAFRTVEYNSDGNPTRLLSFLDNAFVPRWERRFYYEDAPVSVPELKVPGTLIIAPNPAVDQIRLNNKLSARFRVLDLNGRLMMEGRAESGANIAVDGLAPGIYNILLNDDAAEGFRGRFVKL